MKYTDRKKQKINYKNYGHTKKKEREQRKRQDKLDPHSDLSPCFSLLADVDCPPP
jgi:hypothetical protein